MPPIVSIPPQSVEVIVERSMQTPERMDKLGYQDLLSKCIQNGLPGGGYSKSSSTLEGKAEPAVGTGRLLENSTSGSREDTSGAAEGPVAESDSGHREVTGLDGTAVDKSRSPFVATPNSVGTAHMRGRALRSEDLKIDGFPRSLLKSRGMGPKTPPPMFSFRSLLEGAISASKCRPPTSVQRMAESGMQGALHIEPQKERVSGEKHSLSNERRLVGERYDGVVSGRSTPQSCREEKVLSGEGMAESWKEGNFVLRAHVSDSLSGGTVGNSAPHVSYSSLLQAQLGDDVDEVRTETPQNTAGASLVDVEAHSPPVNLQLQSAEVGGGFLSLLEKTTPLLPSVARRASFPAANSLSNGEQISDVDHSDKPSYAPAVDESRSADKVSERDVSESLRATAVPASPALTRAEEDVSRAEVVVERGRSLVADSTCIDEGMSDAHKSRLTDDVSKRDAIESPNACVVPESLVTMATVEDVPRAEVVVERGSLEVSDSICIDEETLDAQLPEEVDGALAGDESRSADILSERVAINSLEAAAIPASPVPERIEEDLSPAEVVVNRGDFVVADSVCIDEEMSDVQLFEELSRALAVDESRFPEKVSNGDAIDSSEAAAVPASPVPTRAEEDDARAVVLVERSTIGVADSVSIDERILDVQLSEEPSGTSGVHESRSVDNLLKRDVVDSSEAGVVPGSPVFTRIEEADLPAAGVERASCMVAVSVSGDENVSGVQPSEELSRDLVLDEARTAEIVAERDVIDLSETAAVAASPVPVRTEANAPRVEGVVAGSMGSGEKISDVLISDDPSQALALDGSRSAGNALIGSSEGAGISTSNVPTRTEEDVLSAEFVAEPYSSVVADCVSVDENMLDVHLLEEPSQALAVDEIRNAEIVLEGDATNWSEAAAEQASLVPIRTGEDVPPSEAVVEKEVGLCGDLVVHTEQGKSHLRSFNPADGQVLEERIQSPSQLLEIVEGRLEGPADLVEAGTTLDPAYQASCKEMKDANEVSVGASEDNVCEVQRECVVDSVPATVEIFSTGCRSVLVDSGTGVCPGQAVKKQTENEIALVVEKQKDKMCDAQMTSSTGTVSLKLKANFDLAEVVLEKEADFSKGEPMHSVHTEEVIDDFNGNALVEKSSSTLMPPSGHVVREEPHPTPEHSSCILLNAEGRSEPLDAGAVVGSSWQAGTMHTEDRNGMVGRDQEDNSGHIQILENLMGQDAGATEEHLMGGDYGSGPQRSCVGYVEMTSTTVSPHVNGNLVVAERIHPDGRDQTVFQTEEKVEQEHILRGPEGSGEVVKRPELEEQEDHTLVDEAPVMQMAILHSEIRAVNMGLVARRSEEYLASELVVVKPRLQNEEERVPKGHAGGIVNDATDSGYSGDPVDQVLSADPDAISEGLRQVFLRDSDATVSDSLESVLGTGAEIGAAHQQAGREVQSPLKSKDRHTRHLDDLEDRRTRHLDDLEENEEQPYASTLNGTVSDQLLGAEVRPYKKKGRQRVYNHEKALHGTGRPHLRPSGSIRKGHLQNAGDRSRRNRHIDPDQPVPVYIEGRDEGFEEADGGAFSRWLAHQNEGNAVPSPAVRKRARKHDPELFKPIIAIPSFRVVSGYEDRQQEVEKRRKLRMQQQPVLSSRQTFVSSSTVQPSEYDMDDEDERWLHAWNKRLARGGLKQPISEDKFEEMIEYFERRSAEMDVSAAGDFPGFPHFQMSSAQPAPGGSLPRTSPSGLGLLNTNPATSVIPVPENAPLLNPPTVRSGHSPWAGGLKDVLSSGGQAMVSSSTRVDTIERNICKSAVDTGSERPSEGALKKSFEPPALKKPSDDCCICNGGEDDEYNPVYTCKRCFIHVHQSCYGIREKFRDDEGRVIAPSNWCCRKCEAVAVGTAQPNVSCVLCRKRGGALKPTVVAQKWAHVACALYTNETFFVDPDAMEPIDGIAAVTARAQERRERCGLCGVKRGICSLCAVKDCRAPFHISCGVSQGASFELRQSKQKVVGVRSFCPRHARTTAMDSAPSAGLKERQMVSSSSTSGATASATASGSISTASSLDDREEGSSRQSISHPDGSFGEPAALAKNVGTGVADLTDNVMGVTGKGDEDAGRGRPKGIRFTLKRRWDQSCAQVSEDGLSLDRQEKCGDGTGVSGDKMDAPRCKSTWHVVEPGQKLKKIKFKFGRLTQNPESESPPTLVQQERIGSEDLQVEKMKDVMPAVGEVCGDAGVNERDAEFVKGLSEDRFAKEVKELMILEEAMKSGVAPGHIMREAFVYWRSKRAESKGSLICELHHEQWLRSQGIFNKDASDEERVATGKMGSPMSVPLAQQPSPMSTEKTLEMAKEIRMQLERVRSMAQMVVQREKLKYNQQLVLGSIASAELNRAECGSEERRCVWCPSTRTLLKCGTCPRSFCFNCFKHRKGFGVKGWMAAMKLPMYICKYCRELSSKEADLSNNLDPAPKRIVAAGVISTPVNTSEPVDWVVNTPVITSETVVRGKGMGKGRGKGRGWRSPGFGSFRVAEGGVMGPASQSMDVNEGRGIGPGVGRGKGSGWTVSENAGCGSPRRGSENGARNQSKPGQLEAGLNKFLNSAHGQMEHSSFETTLRRLKILRCANQEVVAISSEIPSGDMAEETADVRDAEPGIDGLKIVTPTTTNGDNVAVPVSPGPGPALLVYNKKRKLILGASSESPPSAYDFGDMPYNPLSSPTGIENGTSEMIRSPGSGVVAKLLEIGDGAATE